MALSKIQNNSYADTAVHGQRNLIINGAWQCTQRGDYTSATALPTSSAYYLDRFKFRRGGVTGTFTHKLDQTLDNNDVVNTVRLDVTSTATGNVHVFQIFEDVDRFKNKTITFSARVKSNSTNARLIINADGGGGTTSSSTHTGGSGWELLKGTATITSGATGVQLYCGIQAAATGDVAGVTNGDFFEISEIQVEVGEQATPFEHRSFGDELQRCMRYYEKSYPYSVAPGTAVSYPSNIGITIRGMDEETSGQRYITNTMRVEKRADPTNTFYDDAGNAGKVTTFNNGGTGTNNVSIGLVVTQPSMIGCGPANSAVWGFGFFYESDAEL